LGSAAVANGRIVAVQPVSLRHRVMVFSPTPYFSASWRLVLEEAWSLKSEGHCSMVG
jgi:hypothetical protein